MATLNQWLKCAPIIKNIQTNDDQMKHKNHCRGPRGAKLGPCKPNNPNPQVFGWLVRHMFPLGHRWQPDLIKMWMAIKTGMNGGGWVGVGRHLLSWRQREATNCRRRRPRGFFPSGCWGTHKNLHPASKIILEYDTHAVSSCCSPCKSKVGLFAEFHWSHPRFCFELSWLFTFDFSTDV